MQPFEWYHMGFLILATVLDIISNIFLKYSDGFRRLGFGILSLIFVLGAFACLAQAVKGIDLTVAYALWGGFGIVATMAAGWIIFRQRLNVRGWLGLICLLVGMTMIKLA